MNEKSVGKIKGNGFSCKFFIRNDIDCNELTDESDNKACNKCKSAEDNGDKQFIQISEKSDYNRCSIIYRQYKTCKANYGHYSCRILYYQYLRCLE